MWRCKHVADALAKYHYWDLPWAKRLGLKTHVRLCLVCGRFHRQVMIMQDAVRIFRQHEAQDPPPPMPDDAKERLKKSVSSSTPHVPGH